MKNNYSVGIETDRSWADNAGDILGLFLTTLIDCTSQQRFLWCKSRKLHHNEKMVFYTAFTDMCSNITKTNKLHHWRTEGLLLCNLCLTKAYKLFHSLLLSIESNCRFRTNGFRTKWRFSVLVDDATRHKNLLFIYDGLNCFKCCCK